MKNRIICFMINSKKTSCSLRKDDEIDAQNKVAIFNHI